VHGFVLAAVEQATAPLHQRLDELEKRSLYLIRRIAALAAYDAAPSRPETPPPSSEEPTVIVSVPPLPQPLPDVSSQTPSRKPRDPRWRKAAAVVGCALALGLGSLLGLAASCH
jgi:hypothetical protein